MSCERYLLISSDAHAGLPLRRYRDYLESRYHAAFDAELPAEMARRQLEKDTFMDEAFEAQWLQGIVPTGLTGAWDSAERERQQDAVGIAGEIIFPDGLTDFNAPPFNAGFTLPVGEGIDPELQWAGARAHNRWIAEFCAESPLRRAGLAVVPVLYDVEAAVAEIRQAKRSGLRGLVIPAVCAPHPEYNSPRYEPIWAVCEELGMVVHTHGGAAPYYGRSTDPGIMGIYMTEFAWWAYRPVWFLIWAGVFERHPRLQFVVTELGANWVPLLKSVMDHRFERNHVTAKLGDYHGELRLRPSEYFDRNVSIGSSFAPRSDVTARHAIGLDNIMWGADYPHPEGLWPEVGGFLRESFHDVPEDERRAMMGLNAAALYGFDVEGLAPLVDRIGPRREDLDGS